MSGFSCSTAKCMCFKIDGRHKETLQTHSEYKNFLKGKLQLELTLESISCAFWVGLHSGSKAEETPQIEQSYWLRAKNRDPRCLHQK